MPYQQYLRVFLVTNPFINSFAHGWAVLNFGFFFSVGNRIFEIYTVLITTKSIYTQFRRKENISNEYTILHNLYEYSVLHKEGSESRSYTTFKTFYLYCIFLVRYSKTKPFIPQYQDRWAFGALQSPFQVYQIAQGYSIVHRTHPLVDEFYLSQPSSKQSLCYWENSNGAYISY